MTTRRPSRCFALIPAAGVGARTGAAIPKQYLAVAGAPLLMHVIRAFAAVVAIERVLVVVAPDDAWIDALLSCEARPDLLVIVRDGGDSRDRSVANGLAALSGEAREDDWVLVHDAARCGITPALIERLIDAVGDDPVGGLLAVPIDDTVKRSRGAGDARVVVAETLDRRDLWRAQTPQMFRYGLLRDALAIAHTHGRTVTDEAGAVEATGGQAVLVPGSSRNFKVTTADDLALMDLLLQAPRGTVPSAVLEGASRAPAL